MGLIVLSRMNGKPTPPLVTIIQHVQLFVKEIDVS